MGEFRDPAKSMKTGAFNLARNRMEKRARGMAKQAGRPMEGIWYWAFLKPDWKLFVWTRPVGTGEDFYHVQAWPKIVTSILKPHYGLSDAQAGELAGLPYSMPRGRVTAELVEEDGKKAVYFFIRHGEDTPVPDGQRQVASEFGLGLHLLEGMAEMIYDPEETMVVEERSKMEELLGLAR